MMKDALGQELQIDDKVAYRRSYSNDLTQGRIVGFTPKGVRVVSNELAFENYGQFDNRAFSYVAKIERQCDI